MSEPPDAILLGMEGFILLSLLRKKFLDEEEDVVLRPIELIRLIMISVYLPDLPHHPWSVHPFRQNAPLFFSARP